jgi:hypothetical protein
MIYTILVFTRLEQDEYGWSEFGSERIVGYYTDKEKAFDAVKSNACDINETCYNYALIEEVEEGLYNPAFNRWLFKYNSDIDKYEPIEEPGFMKHFSGFTIG